MIQIRLLLSITLSLLLVGITQEALADMANPTSGGAVQMVLPEGEIFNSEGAFFSLTYGGKKSTDFLKTFKNESSENQLDENRKQLIVSFTDPDSGLVIVGEAIRYRDFPAIEWVLKIKNEGTNPSPILENILPLDLGFPLMREKKARVHYANGSECRLDDFAPFVISLGANEDDPQAGWIGEGNPFRLESKGGRSSCGRLPFINLNLDNQGWMVGMGWTGDWFMELYRTDTEVRMRGGMKKTHLSLLPGEEIRTPRILLLGWENQPIAGHNQLRQFLLAHHSPQINGQRAEVPIGLATWGGNFIKNHLEHGKWIADHQIPFDLLWVDAGWFGNDETKEGATVFNSRWGAYVGDWHANPGYFPEGLAPLGASLKQEGLGFLLWLEPERVFKGTRWTREHPEFLLGPQGDNFLFNLGNPEARKMLADFLVKLIQDNGLTCYRQDFNMDPRPFWDAADTPDRIGMSEINHITGLYALWDELLDRCPGLLIDNCSSGGRRIDLETVSRSIPLWRSDVQCWPNFGTTAMQGQTHGLGSWVPLSSGCCDREDTYVFRSALGPGMVLIMYEFEKDIQKHFSVDWFKSMLGQMQRVRPYFTGDFYPLLSFTLADDAWAAWQFNRKDLNEGMILALRRPKSPFSAMIPKLEGLDPGAEYEVEDIDSGNKQLISGKDLLEKGISLQIEEQPGSRLLVYKRI